MSVRTLLLWILLCLGSICVVPLVLSWQKRSKQNKCQPYYSENAENPTDRCIVVGGRLYSYGKLIFLLLSLLVLVVFGLYKGCVLFDAHGYNKFRKNPTLLLKHTAKCETAWQGRMRK